MSENEPPPMLDYRSPQLSAWSLAWRTPTGIIFPYSAGSGIGSAMALCIWLLHVIHEGSPNTREVVGGVLCFGVVTFVAGVWMSFLTVMAVALRMLITPGPCTSARRTTGLICGLIAGVIAGIVWISLPSLDSGRYALISNLFVPAAVAAAIALVGRARMPES